MTRYSIGESSELIEEGTVNFSNYGLQEGQFDSWNVSFLSPKKAYLLDFAEGTTIIWDPTAMEIVGDIQPPTSSTAKVGRSKGSARGRRR